MEIVTLLLMTCFTQEQPDIQNFGVFFLALWANKSQLIIAVQSVLQAQFKLSALMRYRHQLPCSLSSDLKQPGFFLPHGNHVIALSAYNFSWILLWYFLHRKTILLSHFKTLLMSIFIFGFIFLFFFFNGYVFFPFIAHLKTHALEKVRKDYRCIFFTQDRK